MHHSPSGGDFLIVPMPPNPNGTLHLGHAAGPYLRADVIARHLRRLGNRVSVVSGSDSYENWILLDAVRNERSPEETCRRHHELIGADLRNLGVELDAWIDPLEAPDHDPYLATHEAMLERLRERGAAVAVREEIPVSSGSGRYVVGVWLFGVCPNCGVGVSGNCCEDCGYHFQPEEVLQPRSRLDEGPLRWETVTSWFLRPPEIDEITRAIDATEAAAPIRAIATRYMAQSKGNVRLSLPSAWGLHSGMLGPESVLANSYYAYAVYCGEVYRRLHGTAQAAFERGSPVTTIGVFGVDNAIAGLVGPHAIARLHGELKPFDHVVVNFYLNLEGEKFSTSRRHAIWVSELIESGLVSGDEVRYHLSHAPLETEPANFSVTDFVARTNALRERLGERLTRAFARAGRERDSAVLSAAQDALERQAQALRWDAVSLASGIAVFDRWLELRLPDEDDPAAASAWLMGLALLGEPFVPALARTVWSALGLSGAPSAAALRDAVPAPAGSFAWPVRPLSEAELRPYVYLEGQRALSH